MDEFEIIAEQALVADTPELDYTAWIVREMLDRLTNQSDDKAPPLTRPEAMEVIIALISVGGLFASYEDDEDEE